MGMLAFQIANQLRISGSPLSDSEILESRRAINTARTVMPSTAHLVDLIWWLFVEAMDTHKRMPGSGYGNGLTRWPLVFHTSRERWEAELQRLVDLKMSKEEPPLPRFAISDPTAIDRMLVVLGWVRYIKSNNLARDTAVFLDLASGKPPRIVKRHFPWNCCDSTVTMTKQRVLRHISLTLEPYTRLDT
jgi:hypothetical protein